MPLMKRGRPKKYADRYQKKPEKLIPELVTIGQRIRNTRIKKGWTLDDFAAKMDIESPAYLGKIENGYINTTLLYLIKIANVLDTPLDKLTKI